MTNKELIEWAQRARRRAVKTGSMSALWDLIGDAEAVIEGDRTLLPRETIEELVKEDIARGEK